MQKFLLAAVTVFVCGALTMGAALAQQTPATTSNPSSTPAAQAPASQTPSAPAKTPSTTKPKTSAGAGAPLSLKTQKEKFSYAVGMNLGERFKKDGVDIDPAILSRAIRDTQAGRKTLLTDDQAREAIMSVQKDVMAKQQEKNKEAAAANKKTGEAFLEANKSKEGVKALPDGLEYKVLTEGNGPKPTKDDKVSVNYRGTLIDGKEFDSSYKRGEPATFPVTGVIKGWTEALQLMPVGSKWQLFIPSDLAYGDRGAGADIGPSETLIFEVELLSIVPKDQAQPQGAAQEKK
jgi:FKBP-type peptidyl-prolyl cis-trans isomerase FklB